MRHASPRFLPPVRQRDILDSEEYYNADKAIQSFLLKILPSVPSAWSFASCYLALSGLSLGMLDWSNCTAVERSPERVSGAWLFKGTRVPVKALFENLEEGARLDDFLDWFPGVTREQVLAVLNHAEKSLVTA